MRDVFQKIDDPATPALKSNCAIGDISRWPGERGLVVSRVDVVGDDGPRVKQGGKLRIEIDVRATEAGEYQPRVSILVMDLDVDLARLLSPPMKCKFKAGQVQTFVVGMDEVLFSPGEYGFSVGLYAFYDPDDSSKARRFELLGRSFGFEVTGHESPSYLAPPAKITAF